MEDYIYSFYKRVTDFNNNEETYWSRRFITVQATEEQLKEMIKVLQDKHHPLFQMIHGNFQEVYLGKSLGIGEIGQIYMPILEPINPNLNLQYIQVVKGDTIDINSNNLMKDE